MEGTGNSLGALAAAAAATQHAAPAAAVTSQSILRDMRLILSAKDTKLQEKEGELGRMRGELTTAKTTAITHRKTAEELVSAFCCLLFAVRTACADCCVFCRRTG
jgi:hypothetical protein